jgi:hypothetical protein
MDTNVRIELKNQLGLRNVPPTVADKFGFLQ